MKLQSAFEFFKLLSTILIVAILIFIIFYFIFDLIILKKSSNKYMKIKEEKDLIDKFNELLNKASDQTTNEILECLLEFETMDNVYNQIMEKELSFLDEIEYLKLKEEKLSSIIEKKIEDIKPNRNKKESINSLIGELKTCKNRYPEYNKVFVKYINRLSKKKRG